MAQTFTIAESGSIGENQYQVILNKEKVSEEIFWEKVKTNLKILCPTDQKKYDESFQLIELHLLDNKNVTIKNTWFEIKGKK